MRGLLARGRRGTGDAEVPPSCMEEPPVLRCAMTEVKVEDPSISRCARRKGIGERQRKTPPSHVSCKGGVGDVLKMWEGGDALRNPTVLQGRGGDASKTTFRAEDSEGGWR